MNIEKAIELNTVASQGWPTGDNEHYYKALELGIEALKNLKNQRATQIPALDYLLPGETKE